MWKADDNSRKSKSERNGQGVEAKREKESGSVKQSACEMREGTRQSKEQERKRKESKDSHDDHQHSHLNQDRKVIVLRQRKARQHLVSCALLGSWGECTGRGK